MGIYTRIHLEYSLILNPSIDLDAYQSNLDLQKNQQRRIDQLNQVFQQKTGSNVNSR